MDKQIKKQIKGNSYSLYIGPTTKLNRIINSWHIYDSSLLAAPFDTIYNNLYIEINVISS